MTRFPRFAFIPRAVFTVGLAALFSGDLSLFAATSASATALANVADPAERIRFLRAEIARHDELYYPRFRS